MPWVVGIDEAGYGPNLGPLVMTSVACRVPRTMLGGDWWSALRPAVRRHFEPEDDRLVIEDSKLVYSPARGLLDLETGVLAVLSPQVASDGAALAPFLDWISPGSQERLRGEPWYTGTSLLPVQAEANRCRAAAEQIRQACAARQLVWGMVRSVVICPAQFNQWLDEWGSKGAVLGQALAELLHCHRELDGPRNAIHFVIDKHGGRNNYAALLQHALPDGMVVAREEGHDRSVYGVLGLAREVRLTFQPRADAEHFCVALASMVSKYVRELLMREFNAFWRQHVPDLKPTAGYPGDSARFFEEIRPAAARLGIAEEVLWRRR